MLCRAMLHWVEPATLNGMDTANCHVAWQASRHNDCHLQLHHHMCKASLTALLCVALRRCAVQRRLCVRPTLSSQPAAKQRW
jgi:hypothetical protein